MSLLNAHWFDFVAVVLLVVGFKTGQHKEALPKLLSVCRWALTLFLCSFLYKLPAIWLAKKLSMQPDVVALIIFPIEFLLVYFLLGFIWRRIANNTAEMKPFGNWEDRVTKAAGALRYLIFTLVVMAWISGRYVTEQDLRNHEAFCKENFGNITYPVLCTVNNEMFNGSYTGQFAKKYLGAMLMTPLPRFDYGEKPRVAKSVKTRKVQLRELDSDFQREEKPATGENAKEPLEAAEAKVENVAATNKRSNGPASNQIVYRDLTLKGISGSRDRLFALINDQTFSAGELSSVRFEDRKLVVQCVQILERSVVIRLEDEPDPIRLELGVATNLKGEPVVKGN